MSGRITHFLSGSFLSASLAVSAPVFASEKIDTQPSQLSDITHSISAHPLQNNKDYQTSLASYINGNPTEFCIQAGEALKIAPKIYAEEEAEARDPALTHYTRQQRTVSKLLNDFASYSNLGKTFTLSAVTNRAILCAMHSESGSRGLYLPEQNAIAITTAEIGGGSIFLDYYHYHDRNRGFLGLSLAEEVIHQYQHHNGTELYVDIEADAAYKNLYLLVMEAHAKTILATVIAEEMYAGNTLNLMNMGLSNPEDRAAINQALKLYAEHGRKAVLNDAGLLSSIFTSFLANGDFVNAYINHADINSQNGYVPEFSSFAAKFDTIPGFSGKMLSTVASSYSELLSFFPKGEVRDMMLQKLDTKIVQQGLAPAAAQASPSPFH